MRRILFLLLLSLSSFLPGQLLVHAQESQPPVYVQFCQLADRAALLEPMTLADRQITATDDILASVEALGKPLSENIPAIEALLSEWNESPKALCLAPLNADLQAALYELLIAALYSGQAFNQVTAANHLDQAKQKLVTLKTEIHNATMYLETTVFVTPASPTPPGTFGRSSDVLNSLISDYLLANGIAFLRAASYVTFPAGAAITIQLNQVSGGDDFANALVTLDRLSEIIQGWEELPLLTVINIEIYNTGGSRTLLIQCWAANFFAYYYTGTITREAFQAMLIRQ